MCGRFTLYKQPTTLAAHFDVVDVPDMPPRYNIAPTQDVAVVRQATEGRTLDLLRWGLVPFWAKDLQIGAKMINARAETVAEKPAFRKAFASRRCLVVADGYYEWQRASGTKQPFYFCLQDEQPFAFAGLWEQWTHPDGKIIETCTVLTTTASDLTSPIHDRMPVILHAKDHALWLDPTVHQVQILTPLLQPYPAEQMQVYPVSSYVNNSRHNGIQCIERVCC